MIEMKADFPLEGRVMMALPFLLHISNSICYLSEQTRNEEL